MLPEGEEAPQEPLSEEKFRESAKQLRRKIAEARRRAMEPKPTFTTPEHKTKRLIELDE